MQARVKEIGLGTQTHLLKVQSTIGMLLKDDS